MKREINVVVELSSPVERANVKAVDKRFQKVNLDRYTFLNYLDFALKVHLLSVRLNNVMEVWLGDSSTTIEESLKYSSNNWTGIIAHNPYFIHFKGEYISDLRRCIQKAHDLILSILKSKKYTFVEDVIIDGQLGSVAKMYLSVVVTLFTRYSPTPREIMDHEIFQYIDKEFTKKLTEEYAY